MRDIDVSSIAKRHELAKAELEQISREIKAAILEMVVRDNRSPRHVARLLGVSHAYVQQVIRPYRVRNNEAMAKIIPIAK